MEGKPLRLGKAGRRMSALRWFTSCVDDLCSLTQSKRRIAVAVTGIRTTSFPELLPHRVEATIQVSYPDAKLVGAVEDSMRAILKKEGFRVMLEETSDRPPLVENREDQALYERLAAIAEEWDIPLSRESSAWPSVAGLVPPGTATVCGMGPVGEELYTPRETVQRISLVQRTLLLAGFLATTAVD